MARKPLTEEEKAKVVARLKAGREAKQQALQSKSSPVIEQGNDKLPPDLLRPVEDTNATPQQRAHWVRVAFASRGWPNKEHLGTVRDFLVEYKIPIIGE